VVVIAHLLGEAIVLGPSPAAFAALIVGWVVVAG
jgi:hypothetical protein